MASVTALFTDRHGGVSVAPFDSLNLGGHVGDDPAAVTRNRGTLAEGVGVDRIAWMEQVHGDRVAVVASPDDPTDGVDAIVTATPGLALGVLVADCVPVLMIDQDAGVVAAVHAGRRGVQADVVLRALEVMQDLGATAQRVEAQLGPAICGACYEVPAAMQADVASVVPAAAVTTRWGTPGLDLRRGLQQRLAGRVGEVRLVGPCALESPDHYSYRGDGGRTGRFAGVVRFTR
jgi:YfiH family protein